MPTTKAILSVSQLNQQIRSWLEHEIGAVSVEGEVSNLSKPTSGHLYFTLKDASAQIRCVCFRNRHVSSYYSRIQNGQQVLINGKLSLYEARGDYQLIVEHMEEAGEGNLYRQFELLKEKLSALGLFEASRKKPLPKFPYTIGVVTSATGAALRDVLSTLKRRFPIAEVLVLGCEVQGKNAALQLIQAIEKANKDQRSDVLILARGGGSIEDLWAFNDEQLAYAIVKSTIPIVSGVGHETDFTIADFVADLRAATPTAAAEAATPNMLDLIATLQTLETRLLTAIARFMQHCEMILHHEIQKITSPKRLVNAHWQSLDYLKGHLERSVQKRLTQNQHLVHVLYSRLHAKNPLLLLRQEKIQLQQMEASLIKHITITLQHLKQRFTNQLATLHAVSPLATLERGYAIATMKGKVILNSEDVRKGDVIEVRLAKGQIKTEVLE
jgi:exodeoxyribonuclease VII large subunit